MNTLTLLTLLLKAIVAVSRYMQRQKATEEAGLMLAKKVEKYAQKAIDRANTIRSGDRVPVDADPHNRDSTL